ncbi:MAG: acyl carrier protein [Planctomycetes bacterium]|nr:acyl carrier protein [Planctomycetota bacterium]
MDLSNGPDSARRQALDAACERIRRYVVVSFRDGRADGIDRSTPLVSSGIVDSAGVLQLVDWLESSFGISIPDDAVGIENFDSLDALARLVLECSDRSKA